MQRRLLVQVQCHALGRGGRRCARRGGLLAPGSSIAPMQHASSALGAARMMSHTVRLCARHMEMARAGGLGAMRLAQPPVALPRPAEERELEALPESPVGMADAPPESPTDTPVGE
jgi:hypothetical protein